MTVSLPSVAGYAANKSILISGMTGSANGYNGRYTITGVNALTNTVSYSITKPGLPSEIGTGTATHFAGNGITNLYVMQPSTPGGNDPLPVGTLFTPSALAMAANYSVLRCMDATATNNNRLSDWCHRPVTSDSTWSAFRAPLEVLVAFANETGKNLYINIPSNASPAYLQECADLVQYGSDGVNAYTSPQQDAVWAPLDPNLKLYIEYSNELWNSSFTQSEARYDGWANQLSQRHFYVPDEQPSRSPLSGWRELRIQRRCNT